ncbi:transposase [Massilia sp. YIM B02787]|uniref:Transposase n=1 Tax=Massilia orientalis TaxID=3050128 RepID=A0ACC7MKF3_9BURK
MDFKRRLAVVACMPNVLMSKLALEHDLSANMLFKWRGQHRAGLLGADAGMAFLPVAVETEPDGESARVISGAPARS